MENDTAKWEARFRLIALAMFVIAIALGTTSGMTFLFKNYYYEVEHLVDFQISIVLLLIAGAWEILVILFDRGGSEGVHKKTPIELKEICKALEKE